MKRSMLFDFTVDKETSTIRVRREFAASREIVWDAWTNPVILDQWWAPKPFKTHTESMDFREGGRWLYYMASPQDERHWCKNDYKTIVPLEKMVGLDAFCDPEGNTNTDFPRTEWTIEFRSEGDSTLVSIRAQYASLADLEKIIELGFKEGFTMALGNLDELLAAL